MGLTRVSVEGHVATLTLARPEARNALSIALCDEIVTSLGEIVADDEVRVVVLEGEGSTFCAGADFAALAGEGGLAFLPHFERMLSAVADFPLPTIARIHGGALGGGLQLATVCDLRLAATDARLGIPSARLGIVINFENVQRLALLVGLPRAREILMTARTWTGAEAAEHGLVTRAVAPEELDDAVRDLAAGIAGLSPLSVQGAKRALALVERQLLAAQPVERQRESNEIDELVRRAYASVDLQEGLAALRDKRTPRFRGE